MTRCAKTSATGVGKTFPGRKNCSRSLSNRARRFDFVSLANSDGGKLRGRLNSTSYQSTSRAGWCSVSSLHMESALRIPAVAAATACVAAALVSMSSHRSAITDSLPPLAEPLVIKVGQAPGPVTIADVNHDGKPDLLIANTASQQATFRSKVRRFNWACAHARYVLRYGSRSFHQASISRRSMSSSPLAATPRSLAVVNTPRRTRTSFTKARP